MAVKKIFLTGFFVSTIILCVHWRGGGGGGGGLGDRIGVQKNKDIQQKYL